MSVIIKTSGGYLHFSFAKSWLNFRETKLMRKTLKQCLAMRRVLGHNFTPRCLKGGSYRFFRSPGQPTCKLLYMSCFTSSVVHRAFLYTKVITTHSSSIALNAPCAAHCTLVLDLLRKCGAVHILLIQIRVHWLSEPRWLREVRDEEIQQVVINSNPR